MKPTFLILFLSVVVVGVGIRELQSWVSPRYQSAVVDLPKISYRLGDWEGEEVPIADETVKVLDAEGHFNRVYRRADGQTVLFHAAVWDSPVHFFIAPHHPEVCYQAAGWKPIERSKRPLKLADGREIPLEYIVFERGPQRVVTAHVFSAGDFLYIDSADFASQSKQFWGRRGWPQSVKYLFQVNGSEIENAESMFRELVLGVLASARIVG